MLLIKGNSGQTIALLVDQLIGSRAQIVVKPIGQQFSNVGAIAGATILGDGQVCLILDGQSIARQIQATQRVKRGADQRDLSRHGNARRLVMIVDDSVTVRKVTSRLLERQAKELRVPDDHVTRLHVHCLRLQPSIFALACYRVLIRRPAFRRHRADRAVAPRLPPVARLRLAGQ